MAASLKLFMALFLVVAAYQAHGKPVTRTEETALADAEASAFDASAEFRDAEASAEYDASGYDEALETVVQINDNIFGESSDGKRRTKIIVDDFISCSSRSGAMPVAHSDQQLL